MSRPRTAAHHTIRSETMKYAKNTEVILSRGAFAQIVGARALCQDGKVRKVRNVGHERNFGERTGSVKVSGKTVSGFFSFAEDSSLPSGACEFVEFTATGKNSKVFE